MSPSVSFRLSVLVACLIFVLAQAKPLGMDVLLGSVECGKSSDSPNLPVVLVHGIANPKIILDYLQAQLRHYAPEMKFFVASMGHDMTDSITKPVHELAHLLRDYLLSVGFGPGSRINLIGHSQGGLVSRAYVQLFNNDPSSPHVSKLISLSAPQAGVSEVPILGKTAFGKWVLDVLRKALDDGTLGETGGWQGYWSEPALPLDQRWRSTGVGSVLADLNNYVSINEDYRDNIVSLDKFVLFSGRGDSIVLPYASEKFEELPCGVLHGETTPLMKSRIWTEDLIGLRALAEQGRLAILENDFDHADWIDWKAPPVIRDYIVPVLRC